MSDSGVPSSSSTPPAINPFPNSNKKLQDWSKAIAGVDLDGHDLPPSPAPSSPRGGRQYAIATQLVYSEGNDQYNASSMPIYQVSSYVTSAVEAMLIEASSQLRSNRPRPLVAYQMNMTTLEVEIQHGHISRNIWPRSCVQSGHWSSRRAWGPWM